MADLLLAREDEQSRFLAVLRRAAGEKTAPDQAHLVLVHGLGGVGKSELLHRYLEITSGRYPGEEELRGTFLTELVDFEEERDRHRDDYVQGGPPLWRALDGIYAAVVRAVAADAGLRRWLERRFRRFRELLMAASSKAVVADAEDDANQSVEEAIGALAGLAALTGGPTGGLLGVGAKHLAAGVQSTVRLGQARKGIVSSQDLEQAHRSDQALVQAFAGGLRELSARARPIVLLLDTAEILGDCRVALFELIRNSGPQCVWVVAMRFEPEAGGGDVIGDLYFRTLPSSQLRIIEPARFTAEDIATYFASVLPADTAAEVDAHSVAGLTGGLPLAVRLFANLVQSGVPPVDAVREISVTGDVSEVVVGLAKRYLVHVAPVDGRPVDPDFHLVIGLGLARGPDVDPDLLAALWGVEPGEVATTWSRLARHHDFVLRRSGFMHADVRHAVRLFLVQPEHRAMVRDANRRAVEVLRQRIANLGFHSLEAQFDSEDWRTAATALLWHTMWLNDRDGLRLLANLLLAAEVLDPSFAGSLLHLTDEIAPAFSEEVRLTLAGLYVLVPASPLLARVNSLFRSALASSQQAVSEPVRLAREALDASTEVEASPLASGVNPAGLLALIKAQHPTSFGIHGPAGRLASLEMADRTLPPRQDQPTALDRAVARCAAAVGQQASTRKPNRSRGPGATVTADADIAQRAAEIAVRRDPDLAAAWNLVATSAGQAEDWNRALTAYERLVAIEADRAVHHYNVGQTLRRLRRFDDAIPAFERAVQLQPEVVDRHIGLASALREAGRSQSALEAAEAAIGLDPDSVGAHHEHALALNELGRYDEELAAYERAATLDPDTAMNHGNIGWVLLRLGRDDEAVVSYERALALAPDRARYHASLANALARLGRTDAAAAALDAAFALDDSSAELHNELGCVFETLHRYDEALVEYERAAALEPDDGMYHGNVGFVLHRLGRALDAVAAFERAVAREPDVARRHAALATALMTVGRIEASIETAETALRLDERNAEAHAIRAAALDSVDRGEEAAALAEQALAMDLRTAYSQAPPNTQIVNGHRALAILHQVARRLDEALDHVGRALDYDQADPGLHLIRGMVLHSLGRHSEAEAACKRAITLAPANAATQKALAFVYHAAGHFKSALATLDDTIRLGGDDAQTHLLRATVLLSLGRYGEAVTAVDCSVRAAGDGAFSEPTAAAWRLACRGEALLLMGETGQAIECLVESLRTHPLDAVERRLLLAVAMYEGYPDESRRHATAALADVDSDVTGFRLGELRAIAKLLLGAPDDARAELRSVLDEYKPADVFHPALYERLKSAGLDHVEALVSEWPEQRTIARGAVA